MIRLWLLLLGIIIYLIADSKADVIYLVHTGNDLESGDNLSKTLAEGTKWDQIYITCGVHGPDCSFDITSKPSIEWRPFFGLLQGIPSPNTDIYPTITFQLNSQLTIIYSGRLEIRSIHFQGSTTQTSTILIRSGIGGNIIIEGCTFNGFQSEIEENGGAIRIESFIGQLQATMDLFVRYCSFTNNLAKSGAAIYYSNPADIPEGSEETHRIYITDSNFISNLVADSGGAVYFRYAESLQIDRCLFDSNGKVGGLAFIRGGAIWSNDIPSIIIGFSSFIDNTAGPMGGQGGSLWINEAGILLEETSITGNTAEFGAFAYFHFDSWIIRGLYWTASSKDDQTGSSSQIWVTASAGSLTISRTNLPLSGGLDCDSIQDYYVNLIGCWANNSTIISTCNIYGDEATTPIDADGDGYDCVLDCNDSLNSTSPGATETCNGIDDNCNGLRDDGLEPGYFDVDDDGVICELDNCPTVFNVNQTDIDGDGVGDECDECPFDSTKSSAGFCGCGISDDADLDGDTIPDCVDECFGDPNSAFLGYCTICDPGQENTASGECAFCAAGTFSPTIGAPCFPCDAGYFGSEIGATNSSVCMPCPVGFSSTPGNSTCSLCEPGSFNPNNGSLCEPCSIEQGYAPGYGNTECSACPENSRPLVEGTATIFGCACDADYWRRAGSSSCEPCPVGAICPGGSTLPSSRAEYWYDRISDSFIECEISAGCGAGEYCNYPYATPEEVIAADGTVTRAGSWCSGCLPGFFLNPETEVCSECPEGANCPGGTQLPIALKGWWGAEGATSFIACDPVDACSGGGECNDPYEGVVCKGCIDNHYEFENRCEPCPRFNWQLVAFVLGMILAAICLVLFVGKGRPYFSALSIAFNFVQIISLFPLFQLQWPPLLYRFFSWFSIFNLNLDALSAECALAIDGPQIYYTKFMLTLAVPLFFTAIFGTVYGLQKFVLKKDTRTLSHTRNHIFNAFTVVLSVGYLFLCKAIFGFWDCVDRGELSILEGDPAITCGADDELYRSHVPIAVIATIVYVVGIPVGFWYVVRHAVSKSKSWEELQVRVGFLLERYKATSMYWELMVMLQKALFVALQAFFSNVILSWSVALLVLFGYLIALLSVSPYQIKRQNRLAALFSVVVVIILFSGILFYLASLDPVLRAVVDSITVIVVALLIISLAVILIAFLYEIRAIYKETLLVAAQELVQNADKSKPNTTKDIEKHAIELYRTFMNTLGSAPGNTKEKVAHIRLGLLLAHYGSEKPDRVTFMEALPWIVMDFQDLLLNIDDASSSTLVKMETARSKTAYPSLYDSLSATKDVALALSSKKAWKTLRRSSRRLSTLKAAANGFSPDGKPIGSVSMSQARVGSLFQLSINRDDAGSQGSKSDGEDDDHDDDDDDHDTGDHDYDPNVDSISPTFLSGEEQERKSNQMLRASKVGAASSSSNIYATPSINNNNVESSNHHPPLKAVGKGATVTAPSFTPIQIPIDPKYAEEHAASSPGGISRTSIFIPNTKSLSLINVKELLSIPDEAIASKNMPSTPLTRKYSNGSLEKRTSILLDEDVLKHEPSFLQPNYGDDNNTVIVVPPTPVATEGGGGGGEETTAQEQEEIDIEPLPSSPLNPINLANTLSATSPVLSPATADDIVWVGGPKNYISPTMSTSTISKSESSIWSPSIDSEAPLIDEKGHENENENEDENENEVEIQVKGENDQDQDQDQEQGQEPQV